ncbi:MAG: DUF4358 domain-containing protein [Eubacterium sp.]|nr:DUF4358 domain-containing protein [Eubacterium sp.]
MIKGKKILVTCLMLGLGVSSLAGCGKKNNTADAKEDTQATQTQTMELEMDETADKNDGQSGADEQKNDGSVSMYDLTKAILESEDSLPDMTTVNSSASDADRLFAYVSDVDYSKIDSFLLAYSTEGKADEIAVIKLKDAGDMDEMMTSLKAHLKDRKGIYETYDADQLGRVDEASLYSKGDYAVLIICDKKKNIKAVIDEAIGE